VIIDEIVSNVRVIDRESVLDPKVLGQIVAACVRAVEDKLAHEGRSKDEKSVDAPYGLRGDR
jgi:hypothetical protein